MTTTTKRDRQAERRYLSYNNPQLRVRVEQRAESKPPVIIGYGAVFYREGDESTEYRLWSDMVERIMPGAFDEALKRDDVRSLFNHDSNIVLGRTSAGTLKLSVDKTGLRYEVTPPETDLVRDQVLAPIERGDVSGSSFMFVASDVSWREVDDLEIREINAVELWETGPVTFPAYEGTSAGMRGVRSEADFAEARSGHQAWRKLLEAERQQRQRERDMVDIAAFDARAGRPISGLQMKPPTA